MFTLFPSLSKPDLARKARSRAFEGMPGLETMALLAEPLGSVSAPRMARPWPKNLKIPHAKKVLNLGNALLIQGDCLALLPRLTGYYDAIISDPPYGIGYNPSHHSNTRWPDVTGIAGDDAPFDPRPLLGRVKTVVLFGANNFASRLPDSRRWFAWDKRPGMKPMSFSDCELAWCSTPGPARMIRYPWSGAIRGTERGEHWHPTQKPIEVMRQIIETVTKPGDVVLDPYMGSGTSGIAALRCGRRFIGVEIGGRWFENARMRIRRELR